MRQPTLILFICFSILPFYELKSQEYYYYSSGEQKTTLYEVENLWMVHILDTVPGLDLGEDFINFLGNYYTFTDTNSLDSIEYNYNISRAFNVGEGSDTLYESDEVVLNFKSSTTTLQKNDLIDQYNLTLRKQTSFYERYACDSVIINAAKIYESGLVEYSHPNFLIKTRTTSYIPNDSYFNKQFYLHNIGQVINDNNTGTVDADIDAPEAWDITKGDPNIVVAVIDRGISSNHIDLPNTRQVRLPGANLSGVFTGIGANDLSPTNYHGDGCAGIIAAEQDNNIGITGIAPHSKIMPVKFETGASVNIMADCIDFSGTNGAQIISGSIALYKDYPVVKAAVLNSHQNGVVQIYAAGNGRNTMPLPTAPDPNNYVAYPGKYDGPSLITVGASDRDNLLAGYSPINEVIDIVAPSNKIYGNINGEVWTIDGIGNDGANPSSSVNIPSSGTNYLDFQGRFGGTSAATPMVAGVAALVLAVNPCIGNVQMKDLLINTTDKVGNYNYNWNSTKPRHSKEFGYGKVNAHKAVLAAQELQSSTLDLMIKDVPEEFGAEPNTVAQYLYVSEDIWVRNTQDGLT